MNIEHSFEVATLFWEKVLRTLNRNVYRVVEKLRQEEDLNLKFKIQNLKFKDSEQKCIQGGRGGEVVEKLRQELEFADNE